MHVISRDSPCYLLTTVAKNRLLVFRTDELKDIACKALDDARKSGKFSLCAYVIMPDHFHLITVFGALFCRHPSLHQWNHES
jgi:REP element-mobilizing transposase RayT